MSLARIAIAIAAIVLIAPTGAPAQSVQPQSSSPAITIPDSPAGRVLRAWLEAFNSGDAARMDAYYRKYEPEKSAEQQMGFRNSTGGFDLLEIQKSEPLHIEYLVKEKGGDTRARGRLDVAAGENGAVSTFALRAIPPGVTPGDFRIDAATRKLVVEGAVAKLNERYVFPDVAKKMEELVRTRLKQGVYDAIVDGDAFADQLTTDFRSVSHDRHLGVGFSPAKVPAGPQGGGPTPEQVAQYRRQMERVNCGFEKVEVLPKNVGYLKFNMFADPTVCAPTVTAALGFLANVDALIVDLRDNGGGDPKMVAYISTYLFGQRTHLNDLWTRVSNTTQEYWTLDSVPGKRLADKPVFVLTSKRTFSGAEEFSYNLKNLKRATLIGEVTGGGAHPVSGQRIDDHFMVRVPFARAINPYSKTNWEGTGVEPDVKVPAADALTTAQKLATAKPASH